MNQAGIKDDDSRKSVPNTITKDNEDDDNSSNKDIHILPRGRSQSITSTASTTTTSSITSLFESSLSLLGSLPVATSISSSSSSNKPILYNSKYNGIFKLYLNSSVENSDEIQLQSHLLWPSSPKLAELIEENEGKHAHAIEDNNSSSSDNCHIGIKGERVLELGAGSALLSLLSARIGASEIEITDYPTPGIMNTIKKNVQVNLNEEEQSRITISALDWTDESALQGMVDKHPKGFTRILAADTLWMGHLNASQLKVMTRLLSRESKSKIIIVAGLHTGRHVIENFLKMSMNLGLEIERAEELDRREDGEEGINWKNIIMSNDDSDDDDDEIHEGIEEERRRWLVYIILKWPES